MMIVAQCDCPIPPGLVWTSPCESQQGASAVSDLETKIPQDTSGTTKSAIGRFANVSTSTSTKVEIETEPPSNKSEAQPAVNGQNVSTKELVSQLASTEQYLLGLSLDNLSKLEVSTVDGSNSASVTAKHCARNQRQRGSVQQSSKMPTQQSQCRSNVRLHLSGE